MIEAARADRGSVSTAARCLLALMCVADPTPEQVAAAHLLAFGLDDMRLIAKRGLET